MPPGQEQSHSLFLSVPRGLLPRVAEPPWPPEGPPASRAAMWSCRQGSRLLDIPWPSAGLAGLHAAEWEPSWIGRGLPQPLAPQPSSTSSIHTHKHTHGHESTPPAQPAWPLLPRQAGFGRKNQNASTESTSIRAF